MEDLCNPEQQGSTTPVVDGALAHIDCSVRETVRAGDHTIFIGDVGLVITHDRDHPLVYYERSYHRLSGFTDLHLAPEPEPTVDSLLLDYPVPRTFSRPLPLTVVDRAPRRTHPQPRHHERGTVATTEDGTETQALLRTGGQYVKSLQDDREVYYKGERIEDVTTHLATGGGIGRSPPSTTSSSSPGAERPDVRSRRRRARHRAYLVPRTKDDLRFRREGIKHVARRTWGTHGRGIDMIATLPLGMLGELPSFKRECPEFAENIHWYLTHTEENNIHLGETIVDPQGFRSRAAGTPPEAMPPERATARIVKEDSTGIWISGVKGVGTAVPQANELVLGCFHPPLDEESFWVYVPVDSPGLKMFCREVVHRPGSTPTSTRSHRAARRSSRSSPSTTSSFPTSESSRRAPARCTA